MAITYVFNEYQPKFLGCLYKLGIDTSVKVEMGHFLDIIERYDDDLINYHPVGLCHIIQQVIYDEYDIQLSYKDIYQSFILPFTTSEHRAYYDEEARYIMPITMRSERIGLMKKILEELENIVNAL